MTNLRVALAGMAELSEPDHDEAPLRAALEAAGCEVRVVAWDDADPARRDLTGFDACVLRATWNYYEDPDRFLAWVEEAERACVLRNPAAAVAWNLHKRYLLELEAAGVPIVPTACLEAGEGASLHALMRERGWDDVVLKPAVSAGSFLTRRFEAAELHGAQGFLDECLEERDMLVQPFVEEVAEGGELALVWIDGELTHGIEKAPRFDGEEESVRLRPELEPRHREFAEACLAAAGQAPLYARVDVVERSDGALWLSELELIEPSLFFPHAPAALERFTGALLRAARGG